MGFKFSEVVLHVRNLFLHALPFVIKVPGEYFAGFIDHAGFRLVVCCRRIFHAQLAHCQAEFVAANLIGQHLFLVTTWGVAAWWRWTAFAVLCQRDRTSNTNNNKNCAGLEHVAILAQNKKPIVNQNIRAYLRPVASKVVAWLLRAYHTRVFLRAARVGQDDKTTVADLDAVLDRAASLEDFLARTELHEEYFLILRRYFRKRRLHRAGYDKILAQLTEVSKSSTGLCLWLWAKPRPVSFRVQSSGPTFGRGVLLDVWRVYRTEWLESLRARCGLSVEQRDFAEAEAHLSRVLAGLSRKIDEFEQSLGALKKSKRLQLTGKFYAELKTDEEITRAASFLLYRYLITEKSAYLFDSDNADSIIEFFNSLGRNVALVIPAQSPGSSPNFLAWRIKSLIPDQQSLLADTVMFPRRYRITSHGKSVEVGSAGTLEYESASVRPLHGIWTGVVHQDCLGGEYRNLKDLTPRRWAIGGLGGALTFFLSRSSEYQGVIRLVPITGPQSQCAMSIDACAPMLGADVNVGGSKTLLEAWIAELVQNDPGSDWRIALSDSTASDLSQVKQMIRNSVCYRDGQDVGNASDFRISDPLAEQYLRTMPLAAGVQAYGEGFITDATLKDSGKLRLLKP